MSGHAAKPKSDSEGISSIDPKGPGSTAPMLGDNGAAPAPDASNECIIVKG